MKKIIAIILATVTMAVSCEKSQGGALVLESDDTMEVAASGSSFDITFSSSMEWTAESDSEWIHCTALSGAGAVNDYCNTTVVVDPNNGTEGRVGTVTITSCGIKVVVTIGQAFAHGSIVLNGVSHNIGEVVFSRSGAYSYILFSEDVFKFDEDGRPISGVGLRCAIDFSSSLAAYSLENVRGASYYEKYDATAGFVPSDQLEVVSFTSTYDDETCVLAVDMCANIPSDEEEIEPESTAEDGESYDMEIHYVGNCHYSIAEIEEVN